MLSSTLDTLLKLSKTTYPEKLLDYDCIKLYRSDDWHRRHTYLPSSTALRNHNRTVFEEMTSWTDLTMHLGMKISF